MSDTKPLEWVDFPSLQHAVANCRQTQTGYIARPNRATHFPHTGPFVVYPVPGPYDGTIETAKKRCEEHRRNVNGN